MIMRSVTWGFTGEHSLFITDKVGVLRITVPEGNHNVTLEGMKQLPIFISGTCDVDLTT